MNSGLELQANSGRVLREVSKCVGPVAVVDGKSVHTNCK
jgi:hypothetical protein